MSLNPSPDAAKPATAAKLKDGSYRITISIWFLQMLYNQVCSLHLISDRAYNREAVLFLMVSIVLNHEFSHVVVGHLESDADHNLVRVDESDADFRSGVLMLGIFLNHKRSLHNINIKTAKDFLEAAFLAQGLFSVVLMSLYNDNPRYHRPSIRLRLFSAGLLSISERKKFVDAARLKDIFLSATRLLREISVSLNIVSYVNILLSEDTEDQRIFDDVTGPLMQERGTKTRNLSPLLKPFRDRKGDFKTRN